MQPSVIVPFAAGHAEGFAGVCRGLGWSSCADPAVAARGCAAPGASVFVAVAGGDVIGFAQILADGVVQAYLAQVGVLEPWRRQGVARRLVVSAFQASGVQSLDLLTDDAPGFYRSFTHKEKPGFRIHPTDVRRESHG